MHGKARADGRAATLSWLAADHNAVSTERRLRDAPGAARNSSGRSASKRQRARRVMRGSLRMPIHV